MTRLLQMDTFNGVDCTVWRHLLGNQKFGCLDGTRYTGHAVVRLAVSRQPLDQLSLVRAVPPLSSSSMLRPLTQKVREGEAVRAAVEAEQPELAAKLRADMREAARLERCRHTVALEEMLASIEGGLAYYALAVCRSAEGDVHKNRRAGVISSCYIEVPRRRARPPRDGAVTHPPPFLV